MNLSAKMRRKLERGFSAFTYQDGARDGLAQMGFDAVKQICLTEQHECNGVLTLGGSGLSASQACSR